VLIERMYFTGPSHRRHLLAVPGAMAKVKPRARFDALMVEQAVAAGAEFLPETCIKALERTPEGMGVAANCGSNEFGAVILATGSAQISGVVRPARRTVSSIMARYTDFPHDPVSIEMIFARELAPYYAWLFPEPDGAVNLGLLADRRPGDKPLHALFDDVLDRYFKERVGKAKLMGRRFGAPLHVGRGIGQVAGDRLLLVGESAGLVNAATGEGIPWGLESGELAATILARHEPQEIARAHQRAIRRRFGLRLFAAERARAFIGGPLFGPFAKLGELPGMQSVLAWFFAKV